LQLFKAIRAIRAASRGKRSLAAMRRRDNPWYHAIGSALADPLEAEDPPLAGKTTWYYPQIPPEADKSAEDPFS